MQVTSLFKAALLIAGGLTLTACTQAGSTPKSETASALTAYHWSFSKALSANGSEDMRWEQAQKQDKPLKLIFNDEHVGISGLCNQLGGNYQVNNANIEISDLMSTQMHCDDNALMELERNVGRYLPEAVTWQIEKHADATNLILGFKDGAKWLLKGEATAESKYAQDPEIEFVEVAPQTKACTHPQLGEMQCLQTRRIEYNAQGLKQSEGNWQNFYHPIENYEHTPGVRQILRLKHFEDKNAKDDFAKDVYILDMVVESEQLN